MSSNRPQTANKKGGNKYFILFFFFALILYPSGLPASELFKFHQASMGTMVEITLLAENQEQAENGALQAFQEIKRIESLMSPRIESGDVFRINQSAGKDWVKISPETIEVIKKAIEISNLSQGAFDITIAPLAQLWRAARDKKLPPSMEEVKEKLDLVNYRNIDIKGDGKVLLTKDNMAVDLGGIAKGYAVDKAFQRLQSLGYKNFIVNAGGDLRAAGLRDGKPWAVGIQHPREPQKLMAKVLVSDSALATSGDYEKYFIYQDKRYHHIFNPMDGFPTDECQSVTLLHKDGMTADALASAVFVLGPEKGFALCRKLEGVDCLIVDKEGRIMSTPDLKGRFTLVP